MLRSYILIFSALVFSLQVKASQYRSYSHYQSNSQAQAQAQAQAQPKSSTQETGADQAQSFTSNHDFASNQEFASDTELEQFYSNEQFPVGLFNQIHAQVMLAESDSDTVSDEVKDIFPDKCAILIDQIATAVKSKVTQVLLDGADDIRQACPQWDSLSDEDKKDFYVALVTAMALAESSCNNKVRNGNATNGTAYGLWQSTKPLSPVRGAHWVMDQLHSQVDQSGLLFWGNSNRNYWAVLNPNIHAYKVRRLLKKVPTCAAKAIKASVEKQK